MTTMLDAITQAQIWNVVLEFVKENNIGMIIISHEKALIDRLCDRIVDLGKFKDELEDSYISEYNILFCFI